MSFADMEAAASRRRRQAVRSAEFGRNSRTGPFPPTVGVAPRTQRYSVTFLMIEKSPKDLADGKCSRTIPSAPTVGVALARIVRARV